MTDIIRIKQPELVVEGKRLGRHIAIDSRSKAFPAETATSLRTVFHLSSGLPLNQGASESCTAHALCGALNTRPHWTTGEPVLGEVDAFTVYSDEEVLLFGEPYPTADYGGSGLEVCQAGLNRGWLSAYQHTYTLDDALAALVLRPVISGFNWYNSFDTPQPDGEVAIAWNAYVRGGHEVAAIGINVLKKRVWFVNSWGSGWGVPLTKSGIPGGAFYMSFDTWGELLSQGGDVTVPRTAAGWHASPLPPS